MEPESTSDRSPFAAFDQLWAIAVLMHIAANPIFRVEGAEGVALTVTTAVLGGGALRMLVTPGDARVRAVVAVGTIASLWFEAPFTGNHWLLSGIVSVALLVSLTRPDPWAWFSLAARPILLGFYSFAAFAKLNSGFFDPVESCARFYANQSLGAVGFPEVDHEVFAIAVAAATTIIELSVPVLLLFRRTRVWGVIVASTFHFVVSLDFDQHFYDFSSVLFALFALFLADEGIRRAGALDLVGGRRSAVLGGGTFLLAMMVLNSQDLGGLVRVLTFVPWIIYGVVFVRRVWGLRGAEPAASVVPASAAMVALTAIVVANGLTPYLGVKTSTSWNMYANLVTTPDESNHFVIRGTADPFGLSPELVEVVATNDAALEPYIGSGYVVPLVNLRGYLADNRGSSVTVVGESLAEDTLTGDDGEAPNVFVDKFASFRSVDLEGEPSCQSVFFVAR